MKPGALLLVPTPLDFGLPDAARPLNAEAGPGPTPLDELLPGRTLREAAQIRHWVVENAKSARAFLKRLHTTHPLALPLQEVSIVEWPRAPKGQAGRGLPNPEALLALLAPARAGHPLGLMSEAGLPAVADPGSALVALAHAQGVPVRSLPGSSSIVQALAASGLNGQQFAFQGYLPQEAEARARRIRELESLSRKGPQTQVAIETPYRNPALLGALLRHLQPSTHLAVSCALTTAAEWTLSAPVSNWRPDTALPTDQPAIFSWLATS